MLAASRESRLELPTEDQILVRGEESEATHQVGAHLAPKLQVVAHPLFQFRPAWGNAVEAKYLLDSQPLYQWQSPGFLPLCEESSQCSFLKFLAASLNS